MRIRSTAVASALLTGALLTGTLLTGPAAHATPSPTAPCGAVSTRTLVPAATPVLSWSENVGYDRQGHLWVSRSLAGVIDGYDTTGRRIASVNVESPGAVRQGPDGQMYATTGNSPVHMIPGLPRQGAIVSFDPTSRHPRPHVVTRGLGMPNGLAFDDAGAMYVADSALGVVRIRVDGSIDRGWTARAPKNLAPDRTVNGTGMNGIAIAGDTAYVSMTESLTGRILRVPLQRPQAASTAADLTAPLPGIVDDLAVLDSRRLAAATTTGQIIVVDLPTGRRCVVNLGRPATSLAVEPGHHSGAASGRFTVAVGTEDGAVLQVTGGPFTRK